MFELTLGPGFELTLGVGLELTLKPNCRINPNHNHRVNPNPNLNSISLGLNQTLNLVRVGRNHRGTVGLIQVLGLGLTRSLEFRFSPIVSVVFNPTV